MIYTNTILQNRYRILGPIGQGGMGAVYLAEDLALGRRCAVKENVPDPNASPQILAQRRQQFQAEARVLANLDHPNLPKVYDFFSTWGNEYIVMEYVDGENLASILQRQGGPLPEQVVQTWAHQILDALAYLHGQQPHPIIHRDIKPANVILTQQGTIKLVDFGLVKLLDPNSPLTATAMKGVGTPQYAPPEQFAGAGSTDARSDLFSLGAMLYHLLTGYSPADVHQRMVSPQSLIPPRGINPTLSAGVEAAIVKAIELQPDRRYQTAYEMRSSLAGKPARGVNKTVPTAWAAAILALTAVMAAVVIGVAWDQSRAPTGARSAVTAVARSVSLTDTPAPAGIAPPAIVSLATVSATPSATPTSTITPTPTAAAPSTGLAWVTISDDLFLWDPAVGEARQIDKVAYATQWEWAPDGKHIAYQRADRDLMVGTLSDESWQIAPSGDFDWSPDGRQLAYLDRSNSQCILRVVNADGSGDRILADLTMVLPSGLGGGGGGFGDFVEQFISSKRPFEPSADNWLWWTRDGRRIAVDQDYSETCKASLVSQNGDITPCNGRQCFDESATTVPTTRPSEDVNVFLQDEDDALWRFGYQSANIDYAGATPKDPGLVLDVGARFSMPNWGFHNNFWRRDLVGDTRRITESDSFKWLSAWSPDHSWLVFADLIVTEGTATSEYFDAKRSIDLWLLQPEQGKLVRLTDDGFVDTFGWQPLPPVPGSSASAALARSTRPAAYGIFQAPALNVVLDGRFDEWTGPWQPLLAVVQGAEQRRDATDLDARFRVGWDTQGLYLALQVTDDAYHPAMADAGMWTGDGVEITFDRDLVADYDDVHSSADDFQLGLSFGPRLNELRGYRWLPLGRKGEITLSGAVVATSRGYDLEALIPWELLDVTAGQLEADAAFGFNLAVNDNDSAEASEQTILSASPARLSYDNPTQWGTLVLSTEPTASSSRTRATVSRSFHLYMVSEDIL